MGFVINVVRCDPVNGVVKPLEQTVIFADLGPTWGPIVAGGIAIVVFVVLGVLIVKGVRWFTAAADRAQQRAFEGVSMSNSPGPGLVEVVFHAYSGLLVYARQNEYRFWATPDDARLVLSRLNRFNLTWGFLAYGALIIPILSLGNYWVQRNRIRKQSARPLV